MSDSSSGSPKAWLIRAGRGGERDQFALDAGFAAPGFDEVADLSSASTRETVASLVKAAYPDATDGKIRNFTGQLWALRSRIAPGDLIVLPLKTTSQIAIGHSTGAYQYQHDTDPAKRHLLPVKWSSADVPRTAIKQDLLYTLGAFMTICEIKRNDAAWRLQQILVTGTDPGARPETMQADEATDAEIAATSTGIDLQRASLDRIQPSSPSVSPTTAWPGWWDLSLKLKVSNAPVDVKVVRELQCQPSTCAMDSKSAAVDAGSCGQEPQR